MCGLEGGAAGVPAWLRLVAAPVAKASGKLWDGATDAQRVFGDLDGRRPALLGVHGAVNDTSAYRELPTKCGS
ncbi:hypothetical protein OOK36_53200 [Streptomyces sp. NBC_00365]|uniref:hypothetical protein n=1 Tax=Streptomyces sp. NBC_00365 TaxID=2975726 RepID=UPI00224E8A3E|nr:hypothetical protein [Streptomyces sp. NBC_00365]MCX5097265.1 hypothetical protein [Streptomyces sp. NBC_00365]